MQKPILLFLSLCSLVCQAGDPLSLTGKEPTGKNAATTSPSRWSYGASFNTMLGIKVRFSGLGGIGNPTPLPAPGGGVNYDYDDGFVHLDSSGNFDDRTWNWGYQSSSQYDPAGGGSVKFHHSVGLADAAVTDDGESATGIQLSAIYDGGPLPASLRFFGKESTWGARYSLNLLGGEAGSSGALPASLAQIEDTYALNGVVPAATPWNGGSFSGPGPRISDSPVRAADPIFVPGGSTVNGSRDLEIFLASADAGVFVAVPVTKKLTASLETGLSLAVASADYSFRSITSAPGLLAQTTRGSIDDTSLLPGFYFGGNVNYQMNERCSLQAGLRYQYLKSFSMADGGGGEEVEVDFHSTWTVSAGVVIRF